MLGSLCDGSVVAGTSPRLAASSRASGGGSNSIAHVRPGAYLVSRIPFTIFGARGVNAVRALLNLHSLLTKRVVAGVCRRCQRLLRIVLRFCRGEYPGQQAASFCVALVLASRRIFF